MLEKIMLVEQNMNDSTRNGLSTYLYNYSIKTLNIKNAFRAPSSNNGPYTEDNGFRWKALSDNLNDNDVKSLICDLHKRIVKAGL